MALLEVKNLHTYFKTKKGTVKAVNDVSYSLEAGKTIGIVGESGSGKSVSAMSILRLLDDNGYIAEGEILFEGKDLTKLSLDEMYHIRGNAISVIFQEPMTSLNPVFSVEKQLSEPFMIHQGMSRREAKKNALKMLYDVGENERMFAITKSYLHREMDRGSKEAGVKRIRIHDIRHSHVSHLIDMGFSAIAIADRVGHESIDITYNYAHLFPSKQTEMAKRLDDLGKGDFENVS